MNERETFEKRYKEVLYRETNFLEKGEEGNGKQSKKDEEKREIGNEQKRPKRRGKWETSKKVRREEGNGKKVRGKRRETGNGGNEQKCVFVEFFF